MQPVSYRSRVVAAFIITMAALTGGFALLVSQYKDDLRDAAVHVAIVQRDASLAGCNRGRQDRLDAIRGWRAAQIARLAASHNPDVDLSERLASAQAAAIYGEVIEGYRSRIVVCESAFPAVKP